MMPLPLLFWLVQYTALRSFSGSMGTCRTQISLDRHYWPKIKIQAQTRVLFFHPMHILPQPAYYSPLLILIRLVVWLPQSHRKVRRFWFRCIRHGRTGKRSQRAVVNDVFPLSGARVLSWLHLLFGLYSRLYESLAFFNQNESDITLKAAVRR